MLVLGLGGLLACQSPAKESNLPDADKKRLPPAINRTVDFAKDIKPIFDANCVKCHGPEKQKGSLRLDTKAGALKGGDDYAPVIVPGKSADSPLIHFVAGLVADMQMPAKGDRLSDEQIGLLRAWIDQGVSWPATAETAEEQHWSLKPMTRPEIPKTKNAAWPRTPIDRFILSKLEEKGLSPSEDADKRILLRRVYFDVIGLPPTPQEMQAFLSDNSPQAYERVVDQLLSSARYGERWARHWLDIVHYAETHGNDQDRPRPNSWPYRDYVIRSFNQDKSYARFVEEQLAGDVLYPNDPEGAIATGFMATGPWDESSLRDIQENTIDRQIGRYLDRDDIVMTTMSTFTSTTVHCARCHNHKFDPISQAEYYGLQSVFSAIDKADRPFDLDPQTHSQRQALLKQKVALEVRPKALMESLLQPPVQTEVAAWEKSISEQGGPVVWTVLDPITFTSEEGATLTKKPDQSVVSGGKRPEADTYTVTAQTDLTNITAMRLEVLSDGALPKKGPGRQDNGNLHLTELAVKASPTADTNQLMNLPLQNAAADFNQTDWGVAKAIDGDPKTAWGIYPEVGKSHLAVFEFKDNQGFTGGTTFTFVLEQKHGGGHLIGRFRLSVTTTPRPVRVNTLPDAIARILAVPADQRTQEQKLELAVQYLQTQLEQKLAALPKPQMVYAGVSDFVPDGSFKPAKVPRPVHVLQRGDINKPGDLAVPGALSCVPELTSRFALADSNDEGERRAALARWIVDPKNTLTWRSIVNRVWHYHFGRGMVDSPNDLGRMGGRPTHPELLDWLATTFRENGGSFKKLHRLILTSSVYRQSSAHNPQFAQIDADNRLLWRMNRSRLDAESIRDATLQIVGKLDLEMGGPSVKQFVQSPGIHVTPVVDYAKFDVDSRESYRRSIYRFIFRTLPDPFMDSLDCADSSQLTATRNTSVTALQALAMLNNHFMVRQSEHFAERLSRSESDLDTQITFAYRLALGRPPTPDETRELSAYAGKYGLANVCRLILNSNEFIFVN